MRAAQDWNWPMEVVVASLVVRMQEGEAQKLI